MLKWKKLESSHGILSPFKDSPSIGRAKIPGGWLVLMFNDNFEVQSLTFVPDPNYKWDGSSID